LWSDIFGYEDWSSHHDSHVLVGHEVIVDRWFQEM
jgi:hypothetical protein